MAQVYKPTGRKAAKIAGNDPKMDRKAEKIRALATANAAANRDTGEYSDNFKARKVKAQRGGVMDREVYNDHEAARIIEFGHFAEKKDGTLGKFVPGQFNLMRALREGR